MNPNFKLKNSKIQNYDLENKDPIAECIYYNEKWVIIIERNQHYT